MEFEKVNGKQAMVVRSEGGTFAMLSIEVEEGRIGEIRIVVNPEKLGWV